MNNKKKYTLIFLVFILGLSLGAQQNEFPRLYQEDVDGGEITRTEFYIGEELWGLINGGADLYLEYGLDRTLLQEINYDDNIYRVEVYGMTGLEEAFGIFSINKFNCARTDTLVKHICITSHQIQATVGRFYFSISNQSGDTEAQNYSLSLLENFLTKIGLQNFIVPEYFQQPRFESFQNQIKLIKGKLGLQNGFPRWEKYFADTNNYKIVLLPIKSDDGFINTALIDFGSEEAAGRFISTYKHFKIIETISHTKYVLLETNLDQTAIDKILK
ncbi:MAG: hypothetical protein C4543_00045 [Ignavibacteriales bacterium]|nr:MAG: hypothetical protein C4543_00045 [Ignavibacteriales bacterium]